MNYLNELLLEKSDVVIEVKASHDVHCTLQKKSKIINAIMNDDDTFGIEIQQKLNSCFSYGDKFFAPINELFYVCIPPEADLSEVYSLLSSELSCADEVIANYKKEKRFIRENDYFDIN